MIRRLASWSVAVALASAPPGVAPARASAPATTLNWTTNGPYGGRIDALAMDPSDPATLYAGTDNALCVTHDRGGDWSPLPFPLPAYAAPTTIEIDPADANTILVLSSGGVIDRSTDGGLTWTDVTPPVSSEPDVTGLAMTSSAPSALEAIAYDRSCLGCAQNFLYRSQDWGTTWTQMGLVSPYSVTGPFIDPTNPNVVYAGDQSRAVVYKSVDGGATWQTLSSGLPASDFEGIANITIDPSNGSVLYASGVVLLNSGLGLEYKSIDGGASWTIASTGLPADMGSSLGPVAVDPTDPSRLFVCPVPWELGPDDEGMYTSTDGAGTWTATGFAGGCGGSFVGNGTGPIVDPTNDQRIYVGDHAAGVVGSRDGGGTFESVSTGIAPIVSGVGLSGSAPSTLYATAGYAGVFKSGNGGGSWTSDNGRGQQAFLAGSSIGEGAVAPTSRKTAVVPDSFGFTYTTVGLGGSSWTQVRTFDLFVDFPLAFSPATKSTVFAVGRSIVYQMIRSKDGGNTWVVRNKGLPASWGPSAIAFSPSDPKTLYIGRFGGVYKTTNNGGMWARASTGLPQDVSYIVSMAVDPTDSNVVYAGFDGSGIYKTTNGGASWSAVGGSLGNLHVHSVVINPASTNVVYAGTDAGVFESIDGGASWIEQDAGLGAPPVEQLAIDPSGATLYAAVPTGVYSTPA